MTWDDGINVPIIPLWSVLLGAVLLLVARGRHRQPRVTMFAGGVLQHRVERVACPDCGAPVDRTHACPICSGRRHTYQHKAVA